MRYYLDTNLLVFILFDIHDEIDRDVSAILKDYSTVLYASSVSIKELILLFKIGKLKFLRYKSEYDLLTELKRAGIEIVFFNEHHFGKYAKLQIREDHKDMNDHAIIAQAISDRILLVSSDHKFKSYVSQGLNLVFNKR
jgi:PIN domain nuclease of toxin-antitoxin system